LTSILAVISNFVIATYLLLCRTAEIGVHLCTLQLKELEGLLTAMCNICKCIHFQERSEISITCSVDGNLIPTFCKATKKTNLVLRKETGEKRREEK
jgi:hypothetical protein